MNSLRGCVGYVILIYSEEANIRRDSLYCILGQVSGCWAFTLMQLLVDNLPIALLRQLIC